jgi:uncharacterized secreted protein with C-terminal beta-propeller domain
LLKLLSKDFGSEFDDLLPGMFANRIINDAKRLNEAVKVLFDAFCAEIIYHIPETCISSTSEPHNRLILGDRSK